MAGSIFPARTALDDRFILATMTRAHVEGAARIMAEAEPWESYGFGLDRIKDFLAGSIRAGMARVVIDRSLPAKPVVGVVIVQPGFLGGRFLEILALDEGHRGRGLGRKAIDAVCDEMPEHMRDFSFSWRQRIRRPSIFYRHVGFRDVGDLPGIIRPDKVERLIWLRFR